MEWFKIKFPQRYEYLLWAKNQIVERTEADYAVLLEAINAKDLAKLIVNIDKFHC